MFGNHSSAFAALCRARAVVMMVMMVMMAIVVIIFGISVPLVLWLLFAVRWISGPDLV